MDYINVVIAIAQNLVDILTYNDEEDMHLCLQALCLQLERRRGNGDPIPRIEGYVERVIPQFTTEEFKSHFRLLPETFEFVLSEIHEKLIRQFDGNQMISPRKQLLIALWRLASPDSYRSIVQRFGVGKATAVRAVRRVTLALSDKSNKFIKWPEGDRVESVVNGFIRSSGFPGVIGAIDGTHINIRAPKEHPESYIDRKERYSIHLQAVCDHQSIFTHCYTGNVGSVHDARVFSLSSLQDYINDADKFPNDTHLLGDSAYALHTRVLVPYADIAQERKRNFNFIHSSARMAIERAFGLLKGRWRSLLDVLAMGRTDLIPYHIMACCVLHNICLLRNDELLALAVGAAAPLPDENERHFERVDDGRRVRQARRQAALDKRNQICAALPLRAV